MDKQLEEEIRKKAYEIWEYRMYCGMLYTLDHLHNLRDITAEDDWLEAEKEILDE